MSQMTSTARETGELVELAALRIAQMFAGMNEAVVPSARSIAGVVSALRRAFPEFRDVYGPEALEILAHRFKTQCESPIALYFDVAQGF